MQDPATFEPTYLATCGACNAGRTPAAHDGCADKRAIAVLARRSGETVAISEARLFAAQAALTRAQSQIDESVRRVRQSRELITTVAQFP